MAERKWALFLPFGANLVEEDPVLLKETLLSIYREDHAVGEETRDSHRMAQKLCSVPPALFNAADVHGMARGWRRW